MTDTRQAHEERIAWWREAKFGMFIHWGLYAAPAGEWKGRRCPGIGEWIMFKARIPVAEYEEIARTFDPVEFDAVEWADLAKAAGMRYLVITAKHHDGFAMFGSKADRFNIVDATPFRRDPVRELAEACAGRGIRFGVYYSQAQDWHAPGGAIWKGRHESGPDYGGATWDPRQNGDFDAYLRDKAVPQVRELLTGYGPLAIVWFDTPLDVMTEGRAAQFERLVRDLQPGTLVSGRLGGRNQSDYDSEGDNRIPAAVRPGDWETPATLNDTWGYRRDDTNWKRGEDLVFKLVDIVSKGGNYLLNVGPDARGVIPEPSRRLLREVGRWVERNGEAIYGASPTPFGPELAVTTGRRWRCTRKPGVLYVTLFSWTGQEAAIELPGFDVTRAALLGDPARRPLALRREGAGIRLDLGTPVKPGEMPVLRLEHT
jgi:alpha-L-fucosidase